MNPIEEQEARAQRGLDFIREVVEELDAFGGIPLTREQIRALVIDNDKDSEDEHEDECACDECHEKMLDIEPDEPEP